MAQMIKNFVMSWEPCSKESWTDRNRTGHCLQNPYEDISAPEDAMQIDLVPESPSSDCYENIVTAMDVFSYPLFAYLICN